MNKIVFALALCAVTSLSQCTFAQNSYTMAYNQPSGASVNAQTKDYYVQSIYFDTNESDPSFGQYPNLQHALAEAQAYAPNSVTLVGYTDEDGDAQYNMDLADRRIKAVAQYLVDNDIDPNRLIGLSRGENSLGSKADSRRVDVYINR